MIETAEYLRCEIEHTARREMIVKLDDFLRRRSKISLVIRQRGFLQSPGLLEVCGVFFAEDAEARLRLYIDTSSHRRQS